MKLNGLVTDHVHEDASIAIFEGLVLVLLVSVNCFNHFLVLENLEVVAIGMLKNLKVTHSHKTDKQGEAEEKLHHCLESNA